MHEPAIMIVSSHPALASRLHTALSIHGHEVASLDFDAADPAQLDLEGDAVMLLVLATGTPGGLAWCRELRTRQPDAAFCQPVNEMVLQAQLLALARRRLARHSVAAASCRANLSMDFTARDAVMDGRPLPLTTAEFDLLALLARNAGVVLTRDTISLELRGFPHRDQDRSIDLRVHQVRRKLGDDARHPRIIKSVRGLGYLLAVTPEIHNRTDT